MSMTAAFCYITCDCNGCRARAKYRVKSKDGDHEYLMCERHTAEYVGKLRVDDYKEANRPSRRKSDEMTDEEADQLAALWEEIFPQPPEPMMDEASGTDNPTA